MTENEWEKPDDLPLKNKATRIENPYTEFNQYVARILASKWIEEQVTQIPEPAELEAAGHSST